MASMEVMPVSQSLYKGVVTHVIDPSNFWMQIGTDRYFQDFAEYQSTLDAFLNEDEEKPKLSIDSLTVGDYVVVAETDHLEDGADDVKKGQRDRHWKRAQVTRLNLSSDTVDVFYVDIGFTEIVSINYVRPIYKTLVEYFLPQVMQFQLAGVKPESEMWTSRATSKFKQLVINKDLIVYLPHYDGCAAFSKVLLYSRNSEEDDWHSVVPELLKKKVGGLQTTKVGPDILRQDLVEAILAQIEVIQQSSYRAEMEGNDSVSQIEDVSTQEGWNSHNALGYVEADKRQVKQQQSSVAREQETSTKVRPPHHLHLPSPADFLEPARSDGLSTITPPVAIPGFDLSILGMTRSLSLTKMQEDKDSEVQEKNKAQLESDMRKCEEIESDSDEMKQEWVSTDHLIGQAEAFSDVFHDITREINKDAPHWRNAELQNAGLSDSHPETERKKPASPCITEELPEEEVTDNHEALSEQKEFEIYKKVNKILSNQIHGEPDLVCAIINSIVEPDANVRPDYLAVVLTTILESIVREPSADSNVALGVLDTYSTTIAFESEIINVLKTLMTKFVKPKKSSYTMSDTHRAFARVIALVCKQSECWSPRVAQKVQEFSLSVVERWVIFNKNAHQKGASPLSYELIYLECAETFLHLTTESLVKFPERFSRLLDEMKFKLLHDSTNRSVRSSLLALILLLHDNKVPMTSGRPEVIHVATQTEDSVAKQVPPTQTRDHIPISQHRKSEDFAPHSFPDDPVTTEAVDADNNNPNYHLPSCNATHSVPSEKCDSHITENGDVMLQQDSVWSDRVDEATYSHNDNNWSNFGSTESKMRKFPKSLCQLQEELRLTEENGSLQEMPDTDIYSGHLLSTERNEKVDNSKEKIVEGHLKLSDINPSQSVISLTKVVTESGDNQGNEHKVCKPMYIDKENSEINSNVCEQISLEDESSSCLEADSTLQLDNECKENIFLTEIDSFSEDEKSIRDKKHENDVELARKSEKLFIRYRYTPKELKALNPYKSTHGHTSVVVEPYELKHLFMNSVKMNTQIPEQSKNTKPSKPVSRYAGNDENCELAIPLLNANSVKWNKLSDLLPASAFQRTEDKDKCYSSSVDPECKDVTKTSTSIAYSDNSSQRHTNDGKSIIESVCKNSLKDLAGDLFATPDSICRKSPSEPVGENHEAREMWGEPVWSHDFFVSAKPVVSSGEGHTEQSGLNATTEASACKKGKKKKIKFRPLNEVLANEVQISTGEGGEDDTHSVEDMDEFSEEALQMYIDLEEEESKERIIHPSRLGTTSGGQSRRSLFDHIRRQPTSTRSPNEPWVPRQRFCTKCHSDEHIVYDCPNEGSILL